ncbi:MAG: hypothetical protein JW971_00345 [Synergistales bacterium]|nr:hypothetical protein [Synergistales bacterium]
MRYCAIDIGSNSVRHLLIEYEPDGLLLYRGSGSTITRITEGSSQGRLVLRETAVKRTLDVVGRIRSFLDDEGVPRNNRFLFATESLRMAENSDHVKTRLEMEAGVPMELLSGNREAQLGQKGATCSFGPYTTTFDLGGGSLEISNEEMSLSFPLGAVRMTNRFGERTGEIEKEVSLHIGASVPKLTGQLIGVGGTSSSVVMMNEGIPVNSYAPSLVHGKRVTLDSLDSLISIITDPRVDRQKITGLEPLRSDIIIAGISVIKAVLKEFHVMGYIHSETGILWGFLVDKLQQRGFFVKGIAFE